MASRDGDDRRVRKTSIAWSYFTLVDEEKYIASCNTCEALMTFRSSISNLMKHMKRKHSDIVSKLEGSDDEKDSDAEVTESEKVDASDNLDSSNAVWEHFDISNPEKKIAVCHHCQVPLSYKSSVSTLLRHLSKKHNIMSDDVEMLPSDEDSVNNSRAESPPSHFRSVVWPYFKITDPSSKMAICLVCRKVLSYNTGTSNLKKHLSRKHPLIKLPGPGEERKTIILSSGDQLYEFEPTKGENDDDDDQNEPIALDEVYLDEFNGSINRMEPEKKKNKKRKHKRKLIESDSSDDEVILKKKYVKKECDSIDLFAKYIGSLLKQLPKQISNQLQNDFVKQIMNAQMTLESVDLPSAYSITITESDNKDVK